MTLKILPHDFTVCKLSHTDNLVWDRDYFFFSKTDDECSLVCPTTDVPVQTLAREDGWRGFRVQGTLDFSLVGILAGISTVLAAQRIGIFVVSTYDTDYVFVKQVQFDAACGALADAGYEVV